MPSHHFDPPNPVSLPCSNTDEDENLVYWEHSPHPRSHPSSSTPLKLKPKRNCAAAEMPSPSKTLVEHELNTSPGEPVLPARPLTRGATFERRCLRQHKRLRERNQSSAGNDPTAITNAPTATRDTSGIDVLLNRLKEKEGTSTKAKSKVNPGLGSNLETPTRASAHAHSGSLMVKPLHKGPPHALPLRIPSVGTARPKPVPGSTQSRTTAPVSSKSTAMTGSTKALNTNARLVNAQIKPLSMALPTKSSTTKVRTANTIVQTKPNLTNGGSVKGPTTTTKPASVTLSGSSTTLPKTLTRNPAPAPPQLNQHDESQTLLKGLVVDDLFWSDD
ncbi:hypothetical protein CROQUDRAFT_135475 [Cronartium quercuum f. sp. fusiforme G11]|uniref:Uncharacterized protein n=1 Tax=Cronartium quercuum f. sp. fusiforme G11 TaxID=708437 RepID=A0A9P6T8H3_9BASI|nr:hypothetical protein CROQUDRAFT_135475 [Cronartium quercuum f. sp. fusiforme G11]